MLFDVYDRDADAIRQLMADFSAGSMTIADEPFAKIKALFGSFRLDDAGTTDVIQKVYQSTQYLLDPHTAIGLQAGREVRKNPAVPMVCLATAHPAKFPEALEKANLNLTADLPLHMSDLFDREERFQVLENDLSVLHDYVAQTI